MQNNGKFYLDNVHKEIITVHMFPLPKELDSSFIPFFYNFGFIHNDTKIRENQENLYKNLYIIIKNNVIQPLCVLSSLNHATKKLYGDIVSDIKQKFEAPFFSYADITEYTGKQLCNLPSFYSQKLIQNGRLNFDCYLSTINTACRSERNSFCFTTQEDKKFLVLNFQFFFNKKIKYSNDQLNDCVQQVCQNKSLNILFDFLIKELEIKDKEIFYYQRLYNYVEKQTIRNEDNSKVKTELFVDGNSRELLFSMILGKEQEANLPLNLIAQPLITRKFVYEQEIVRVE